ncbi:Sialic acid transporter NanT [Ralstonia condita]|uniref:Sialic acid transporter NanT n=1 Tax=Ralstonia condita TaxID=3058600 RepID=A0ABM9JD94_9RALS|nr:MFS transporter [Ralstonia sp. LMG 7141]CAJ0790398.1 Sialic acid transporter NanT [Ralstonia sp. LMG 7141]
MHLPQSKSIVGRPGYAVSRGHAWFALVLLFILMLFDYIDRSIVNSMFPYIKKDWGLTDTQLGALASIVSLMVGLLSLPVAVLVDRWSRVKSIVLMGVGWGFATVGCMFASKYTQLLAMRAVIGVGEAGYGNAGCSLLAHHFPSRLRSTVIGLFYFAVSVGSVIGIIAGGAIAVKWGWHAAFGIVGVPGIVVALLVFAIKDYRTIPLRKLAGNSGTTMGFKEAALELFRARTSWSTYLGSGLMLITYMAMNAWLPSYFARAYSLQGVAIGLKTAPVILAGACGTVFWAMVADRVAANVPRRRLLITVACGLLTVLVLFPAFTGMEPGTKQYQMILLGGFFMGAIGGIPTAVAMDVVHPGLRSSAVSMVTLANNLIGFTMGPFVVGMLSDRIGLQSALAWVTLSCIPAVLCLYWASRNYDADKALIDAEVVAGGFQ